MTMFRRFVTVVAALFLVAAVGFAQAKELPKVYILATGGTIAGSGSSATNSNYTAGQRVKKGDILFIIEPTLYKDAVRQAEAALQTAKANLEYAENNYERMKIAIKRNAVSQIELLQSQTNVETGKAAVNNAEAQLNTAKTNLGYCYIKAPHDGLMTLSTLSTGSYIAGAASPTLAVAA